MGKLTEVQIKALKPQASAYKVADGDGLTLEVRPTGAKCWRIRYRHAGKQGVLSPGDYPEVSLKEARERLAAARRLLRDGIDPAEHRRQAEAAQVAAKAAVEAAPARRFTAVSEAWLEVRKAEVEPATFRKMEYVTRRYLQRDLGEVDIAELTSLQARTAIAAVAAGLHSSKRTKAGANGKGAESAGARSLAVKAVGYLNGPKGIIGFAIDRGLRSEDKPIRLAGAIGPRPKSAGPGHIPAATSLEDLRRVLLAVDRIESAVVRAALLVGLQTAQRPGEIVTMEWAELDLERSEWNIPAAKMKMKRPHVVPLSHQAAELVKGMAAFTAGGKFVFPALARQRTEHLHRDSLSNALRRLGLQGQHAAHGARAAFRTLARERLGAPVDVLEAQLAHVKKDDVQRAYDRAGHLAERKVLMQQWADFLDALKGGKV